MVTWVPGVQILDRLGHDVGAVVAQDRQAASSSARMKRTGRHPAAARARSQLAVDQHGDRRLGQTGADRGREVVASRAAHEIIRRLPSGRAMVTTCSPTAGSVTAVVIAAPWAWVADGWPENVALHKGCQATRRRCDSDQGRSPRTVTARSMPLVIISRCHSLHHHPFRLSRFPQSRSPQVPDIRERSGRLPARSYRAMDRG